MMEEVIINTSNDKTHIAHAWSVSSGTSLASYKGNGVPLNNGMAFSRDSLIISMERHPLIFAYHLNDEVADSKMVTPDNVTCLTLGCNGAVLAVGVGRRVQIYKVNSMENCVVELNNHLKNVVTMEFNQRSSLLAIGGEDSMITIWTVDYLLTRDQTKHLWHKPLFSITQHSMAIVGIKFAEARKWLISCAEDHVLLITDLAERTPVHKIFLFSNITSLAIALNNSQAFTGHANGTVSLVPITEESLKTKKDVHVNKQFHDSRVTALTCSIDSSLLISGSTDGLIHVFNLSLSQTVRVINTKGPVINLQYCIVPRHIFSKQYKTNTFFCHPDSEDKVQGWHTIMNKSYPDELNSSKHEEGDVSRRHHNIEQTDTLKTINRGLYQQCVKNVVKRLGRVKNSNLTFHRGNGRHVTI